MHTEDVIEREDETAVAMAEATEELEGDEEPTMTTDGRIDGSGDDADAPEASE